VTRRSKRELVDRLGELEDLQDTVLAFDREALALTPAEKAVLDEEFDVDPPTLA